MKKDKLLIIFAKDPIAGKVKARLSKDIGQEKATAIYTLLLKEMFARFRKTDYDVILYFTPSNIKLRSLAAKRFKLRKQKGRDLGYKMLHAFKDNLKNHARVIVIGADCPFIDKGLVNQAFRNLSRHPIVIGPSVDGGYYLIGLSKIYPKIFKNIAWGTNRVLNQTLKQCKLSGLKPILLKKLYDIDTLADLKRWKGKR